MTRYYINPLNENLIIVDTEVGMVVECKQIATEDLPGRGLTPPEPSRGGGAKEKIEKPKKEKIGHKRITCRNCGKPGHNIKTCPQGKSSALSGGSSEGAGAEDKPEIETAANVSHKKMPLPAGTRRFKCSRGHVFIKRWEEGTDEPDCPMKDCGASAFVMEE